MPLIIWSDSLIMTSMALWPFNHTTSQSYNRFWDMRVFRLHSLVVCMQFIDMILPKWNLLIASLLHIKMFIRICLLKMLTNSWHWLSSLLRRLSQISPPPSFRWHLQWSPPPSFKGHLQCRCFRFCLSNKPYWHVLASNLLLTNVMYVAVVLRFTYLCRMLLTRPRVNL